MYEVDEVLDASLYAIFKFHLFDADDPRVVSTMKAVEQKLWVKTKVGGVARYENDYYHRVSNDIASVPGNPWFICTLWLADYFITVAKTAAELKRALPIFEWTAEHALESGVLAEQVNPYTNEPISVSPLTWSHATVVSTTIKYLEKLEALQACDTCNQPIFRLRRSGPVEVKSQATFDRLEAEFSPAAGNREMASTVGKFSKEEPGQPAEAQRHAGDRRLRLHRLRSLRRPLRPRRAHHARRQGDDRPPPPEQVRPERRVRAGLPDRRGDPARAGRAGHQRPARAATPTRRESAGMS